MQELQQSIREDLAGLFAGEFRFDRLTREIYASDGSLYQLCPVGVAYPRSLEDLVVLARYAEEHSLALVPRGAGSGVAGGALGTGLIVDCSRHLTNIVSIGEDTVTVEAGVVRDQLNRVLRQRGRYLAPDPANAEVTTIGGMLGVDAAGSHAVRVGSMRDHVQNIQIVLPGGHAFLAGIEPIRDPLHASATGPEQNGESVKHGVVGRLARLLQQHAALIRERQPPLMRNCSGYHLRTVLAGNALNLPRLLVGSEGTLALFASATLDTSPLPAQRGVALLLYGSLESAIRTVQAVNDQQPTACDLLDRRLLTLAREADPGFEAIIPKTAEAGLIIEQTGFSERQVKDRMRMIIEAARAQESHVVVAQQAFDEEGVEFLWSLPRRVVPLLARLKSGARPVPLVEDIAVPPEALHDFLVRAQRVLQRHQLTASLYCHAATGQVHLRPFLPMPVEADSERIEAIARDLYEVVFSAGGSISGEKGDGLSRTAFIRSQYGPLYRVFQQVKDVFDPRHLLNPGKIISDDQHTTIRHFRPVPVEDTALVPLQLRWRGESLNQTTAQCNGCGSCRSTEADLRMCPFFRVDAIEEASPRAKANAMRGLATGTLEPREMSSESMKRLANLCFNCKQCRDECPANVDIPHLMIEAKAGYVAANGLGRADWFLARAHSWGRLGCTLAPLANWAISASGSRWLIERFLGIARRRKLPAFARRPFLSTLPDEVTDPDHVSRDPKSVVYFVDGYVNHHDPQLGHALLAVLKHNGIPAHVPLDQTSAGMAMVCAGDLAAARKHAQHNVRILSELARDGHTIVCTEPAAAVCLREEYPMILDHPDVDLIAGQVVEAGDFLRRLHTEGALRTDFQPLTLTAGYHLPCHIKALSHASPFAELLALIPGLNLQRIERGCSGMAGAFGLTRENFDLSLKIGEALIRRMSEPDLTLGTTECSSCKLQMEQGTSTPTVHPLKLMALSYGLMPELRERLKPGRRRLVVT